MSRTNEAWSADLRAEGHPAQAQALADLRAQLLRGVGAGLRSYPQVDAAFLEDVVQDALVKILDRLEQFEGRSRFLTWATAIAIRMGLTELRRRRWKDVSLDAFLEDSGGGGVAAEPSTADGQTARRALVAKLQELMANALTEKQRRVMVAELHGLPQQEIARELGSNRNAVYKLTHDARKRLKRGLEEAGYGADDIHAAFAS